MLARIAKARARKAKIKEERITLSHGAGGKATQTLIEAVFLEAFRNPVLELLEDGAQLSPMDGTPAARSPPTRTWCRRCSSPAATSATWPSTAPSTTWPCAGRGRCYLSAGFILEEGFPVADLQRIVASMAAAAHAAGVQIVTGDTKVVERGKADGCYITTAGVGVLERPVVLSAGGAPGPGTRCWSPARSATTA